MSGICAVFNLTGAPVDSFLLEGMTSAMAHRGPYGAGHWIDGEVGMGHALLSATPDSVGEKQPLFDKTSGLCVVLDGRIDNREDLQNDLKAHGLTIRGDTDAELILRAYELWAEDCPRHIVGDFAFALWDRARRKLLCARDPFGMRPFFYTISGDTFACASEIDALFAQPELERQPNVPLFGAYLCERYVEYEDTFYRDVYRLPGAWCMSVSQHGLQKKQYWDIDPDREVRYRDAGQYGEHFGELFHESVRRRLRSSGTVGAFLSGGLDSSSIVCTARHLAREGAVPDNSLESFSVVFDQLPCDERPYIDPVVRKSGVKAHFFTFEKNREETDLKNCEAFPGVSYGPTLFMMSPALKEMQKRRIHVLLDGGGGDELLSPGFVHLSDLLWSGRWIRLASRLKTDASDYSLSPFDLLFRYCFRMYMPPALKEFIRPLVTPFRKETMPEFPEHVRKDALGSIGVLDRIARKNLRPRFSTRAKGCLYDELFFGWNAVTAKDSADLYFSRFGVEVRRPFYDRRLVELVMAIPGEQLWAQGTSKLILRHAMKGILPEEVRSRRGKGIYAPVLHSVLAGSQAREVRELFRRPILAEMGLIDARKINNLINAYQDSQHNSLTSRVLTAVALETLARQISNGRSVAPVSSRWQESAGLRTV